MTRFGCHGGGHGGLINIAIVEFVPPSPMPMPTGLRSGAAYLDKQCSCRDETPGPWSFLGPDGSGEGRFVGPPPVRPPPCGLGGGDTIISCRQESLSAVARIC